MDITDPTLAGIAANYRLKSRYEFSKESGIVEMAGPIFCDVFFSERLLQNYVDLKVVMNPSSHDFCLMSCVDNAEQGKCTTTQAMIYRKRSFLKGMHCMHLI